MELDTHLISHFLNLYHMAIADLEVDPRELELLYIIGEEKGITKDQIDDVILRPDKIKFNSPSTLIDKIECLYDFARIAWADGRIDDNEKRVMNVFCEKFGFEADNIPEIIDFLISEAQKKTSKEQLFEIIKDSI